MSHPYKLIGTFLVWGVVVGCSSTSRLPDRLTRVPGVRDTDPAGAPPAPAPAATPGREAPETAPVPARVSAPERTDPQGRATVPPGPLPGAIAQRIEDWIPLETWSETNHFGPPQEPVSGPGSGWELRAPGGVISLTVGSQLARLNGVSWWLGYAPRLAEGGLLVHPLDAGKNLLPLANPQVFPGDTDRVVVIDPGHGGENTGTRSVADRRFEKEFTLDWALRLQPLLQSNGWKVILTRTRDIDVSLADRVAVADRAHAGLFVSLHFNSGARPDQAGLETYCLTPAGLPSTLTREFEDDVTRTYPNNAFDTQNLQFALRLHRCLIETTARADRGVRRARFMSVLREQQRPAVLVEGGYLSNPREAEAIGAPQFRQRLAEAVARALEFGQYPAPRGEATGGTRP